jgi:hypothetical protein
MVDGILDTIDARIAGATTSSAGGIIYVVQQFAFGAEEKPRTVLDYWNKPGYEKVVSCYLKTYV